MTALRPYFTTKIIDLLTDGKSINVYAKDTKGLSHLIDDLLKQLPTSIHSVRINMKTYVHSYSAFLEEICRQLGIHLKNIDTATVASAVNHFEKRNPTLKLWLFIENFDSLTEKPMDNSSIDKKGYDRTFLDHLNSFNNNTKICLFLTSVKEIKTQELYVSGELVRGSRLELPNRWRLPDLTEKEIKAELERRIKKDLTQFWTTETGKYLSLELMKQKNVIGFLDFIEVQLIEIDFQQPQGLKEKLNSWKKQFNQSNSNSIGLKINNLERFINECSYLKKRLIKIKKEILSLLGLTIVLFGSNNFCWNWWKKFKEFITTFFN